MAIREDIVASAVSFLQDPNVAGSSVDNKISFLRSKNLTQDEIDAAFARSGQVVGAPAPSHAVAQPYYPPPQYQQQQPYGSWPQAPPLEPPRRDWRDLFIMATVVGGVSYGLYSITKVRTRLAEHARVTRVFQAKSEYQLEHTTKADSCISFLPTAIHIPSSRAADPRKARAG